MGFRTFVCMNIAIIGNCRTTASIAEKLALAGHRIFIGLKEEEADNILITEGIADYISNDVPEVYFDRIPDAAAIADIIILSSPAEQIREIAYLLDDVRKKVIIDISGNVNPKPEEYVYTVRATRSITGAENVIKAYSCADLTDILSPAFEGEGNDLFIAGNSKKAKAAARIIAEDLGFKNAYDFGDQDTIPLLEDMARCWHNLAIRQKMGEKIAFKIVTR